MQCDNLIATVAEMRQIQFEAAFWPDIHVRVQTLAAAGAPLPTAFHERLAEALAILSTHDIATMRIDFKKFPAVPNSVETRFIRLGNADNDPRLLFRFVIARQDAPITGTYILVLYID
jgi:hypothetical protein